MTRQMGPFEDWSQYDDTPRHEVPRDQMPTYDRPLDPPWDGMGERVAHSSPPKVYDRIWYNPMEFAPRIGEYVLIWPHHSTRPEVAKFIIGDEDDGVFHGKEVWKDDGDAYYLPDSVEAWMPCPSKPEWLQ